VLGEEVLIGANDWRVYWRCGVPKELIPKAV
jgi:hypothetical protein